MNIEEIKAARLQYLKAVYEESEGDLSHRCLWHKTGEKLGLERDVSKRIVEYLMNEYLVEQSDLGGGIKITHEGVRQIEDALSRPDEPTEYFPPVNIIQIESMINSSIQQAGPQATQVLGDSQYERIRTLIAEIEKRLPEMELNSRDSNDVEAELATVAAQLSSSKPKSGIMVESLKTIRSVLEGTTGSLLASQISHRIAQVLGQIGQALGW